MLVKGMGLPNLTFLHASKVLQAGMYWRQDNQRGENKCFVQYKVDLFRSGMLENNCLQKVSSMKLMN